MLPTAQCHVRQSFAPPISCRFIRPAFVPHSCLASVLLRHKSAISLMDADPPHLASLRDRFSSLHTPRCRLEGDASDDIFGGEEAPVPDALLPPSLRCLIIDAAYAEGLFVFVVAILGLVCKSWQKGTLLTSAPYAAFSGTQINGTVGLYMGLESFNVTLLGEPEWQNTSINVERIEERINYNEIVQFGVRQG